MTVESLHITSLSDSYFVTNKRMTQNTVLLAHMPGGWCAHRIVSSLESEVRLMSRGAQEQGKHRSVIS